MNKTLDDIQVVMPFGRYKGQPIERLLQDKSYARWLSGQEWFRDQFGNINNLIIHNYSTVEMETPEHNAMQLKFMDPEHALKLAYLASGNRLFDCDNNHFKSYFPKFINQLIECRVEIGPIIELFSTLQDSSLLEISEVKFEEKGVDVHCDVVYGYSDYLILEEGTFLNARQLFKSFWDECSCRMYVRAELKPDIGDDFPAVLRQMKASGSNILLIRNYNGTSADYETFMQFFKSQKIKVFKESEIEEVELPTFDKELVFEDALKAVFVGKEKVG